MKQKQQKLLVGVVAVLLLLLIGTAVWAQTSAGFNLEWHVIGNGGGESSSAHYQVNGTVGQPVVGSVTDRNEYVVTTGYWSFSSQTFVYLPIVVGN